MAAKSTGSLLSLAMRSLRFPLTGLAGVLAALTPELDAERLATYLLDPSGEAELLAAGGMGAATLGPPGRTSVETAALVAALNAPGIVTAAPPRDGGPAYVAGIGTLLPGGASCVLVVESGSPVDVDALYEASAPIGLLAQMVVQQRAIGRLEREVHHHAQDRSLLAAALYHDLRGPLTSILGSAQTVRLRWPDLAPQERDELLGCLERQAERLRDTVAGNLRVETAAPHAPLRLERTMLRRLAARAAAAVSIGRSGDVVVEGSDVTLTTDEERLQRALLNLLDNALKHSPAGVPVHLLVEEQPGGAVITVADAGPGVDRSLLPRLFGARGGEHASRRDAEMGLYSTRCLADEIGGRLAYARHSGWSRFTLVVPDREDEVA